jgi:hypothetical protein
MSPEAEQYRCLFIWWFFIFFIIGLPTYLMGCDNIIKGGCSVSYNIANAKVVESCHLHTVTIDDDTYGNPVHSDFSPTYVTFGDCRVKLDADGLICNLYRSDFDKCSDDITSENQYRKCDVLNNHSYPLGSIHTVYFSKNNSKCYSHFYVKRLSRVGFAFLIFSFVLQIIILVSYVRDIIIDNEPNVSVLVNVPFTYNVLVEKDIEMSDIPN